MCWPDPAELCALEWVLLVQVELLAVGWGAGSWAGLAAGLSLAAGASQTRAGRALGGSLVQVEQLAVGGQSSSWGSHRVTDSQVILFMCAK